MNERTTARATHNLLALCLYLCATAPVGAASGSPQELHPLFLDQPGTLALPKWGQRPGELIASVQESGTEGCGGQCFLLMAGAGASETREEFRSATGRFTMYLTDLDGDGLEEIVLVLGATQDNGALQEQLLVLGMQGGKWQRLLETPVAEYYGSEPRWKYALRFEAEPAAGGTRTAIDLKLANDRSTAGGMASSRQVIPRREHVRFVWDGSKREFIDSAR